MISLLGMSHIVINFQSVKKIWIHFFSSNLYGPIRPYVPTSSPQIVHVVSILDVPRRFGSTSFQSNDVNGAQKSEFLFWNKIIQAWHEKIIAGLTCRKINRKRSQYRNIKSLAYTSKIKFILSKNSFDYIMKSHLFSIFFIVVKLNR